MVYSLSLLYISFLFAQPTGATHAELTKWYRAELAQISKTSKSAAEVKTRAEQANKQYREKLSQIQPVTNPALMETAKSTTSQSKPSNLEMTSAETAGFLSASTMRPIEDWARASQALFKAGDKRLAFFAWNTFNILVSSAPDVPALTEYSRAAKKKYGDEIVRWVTEDVDEWSFLFRQSVEFAKKANWTNPPSGVAADQWKSKIAATASDYQEKNGRDMSITGLQRIKEERALRRLKVRKMSENEMGRPLPKAWSNI